MEEAAVIPTSTPSDEYLSSLPTKGELYYRRQLNLDTPLPTNNFSNQFPSFNPPSHSATDEPPAKKARRGMIFSTTNDWGSAAIKALEQQDDGPSINRIERMNNVSITTDIDAGTLYIQGAMEKVAGALGMCHDSVLLAIESKDVSEDDLGDYAHLFLDGGGDNTNTTASSSKDKKKEEKKKTEKKKVKKDKSVDLLANVSKFEKLIQEAQAFMFPTDGDPPLSSIIDAKSSYLQALMLDLPEGIITFDILSDVKLCIEHLPDTIDSTEQLDRAKCISRCIYHLRQRLAGGVVDTMSNIQYHHLQAEILCQLVVCEDLSQVDILHYRNIINKSAEFVDSVVKDSTLEAADMEKLVVIKEDFDRFKAQADVVYEELVDQFEYRHPDDPPCLKTLDAMYIHESIIDVLRKIGRENPDNLCTVEQILQKQEQLADDARGGDLPEEDYIRRYYELRRELAHELYRLTGRVVNLGYGLSALYRVIYNLNYAPPSVIDYDCQLFKEFEELINKIDPNSCCPRLLWKGIVTSFRNEAGGLDDGSFDDVSKFIAFVDRVSFVTNSNKTAGSGKDISSFIDILKPVTTFDAELVFHSIAPNNIMLITTYLNVYYDVRPTIVPCGAPVRDCHESDVVEARANPECTNGGSILHPECLAVEKYASQLSQDEHKRMTKSLLVANGDLPYYVTTPLESNLIEKWAGTLGMTPADRQARDQHLLDIRRKGGNRCYELEHGIFDPKKEDEVKAGRSSGGTTSGNNHYRDSTAIFDPKKEDEVKAGRSSGGTTSGNNHYRDSTAIFDPMYEDEVELWNKQTSDRQLALVKAGKHLFQQKEHKDATKQRQLALSAAGQHPMQQPEVVAKAQASRLAGTAKKKRRNCSHPGCDNQAKMDGVCYKHGANRNARKKCSFPDCNNIVVNNGVCVRHGAIVKRKKCSVPDCNNYVQKGGVCIRHGAKDL